MSLKIGSDDLIKFIDTLYHLEPDGYFELRFINDDNVIRKFIEFPIFDDDILQYVEKYGYEYHSYFGINPRVKKDSKKKSIQDQIIGCWADLDAKDYQGGKEEALERLRQFALIPSIIVDSGNGYHAYWLTKEFLHNDQAEQINRGLAKELDSDSVPDVTRILRLPGTLNLKTDPPKICKIKYIDRPFVSYSLSDLEPFKLSEEVTKPTSIQITSDSSSMITSLDDLKDVVDKDILKRAQTIPDDVKGDRSINDFWVACRLYESGFSDEDIYKAFELFAKAGWDAGIKFKEKGKDYLIDYTLPKAKNEKNLLDSYIKKIKGSTGKQQLKYIETTLDWLENKSPVEQELGLKQIKQATNGTLTLTQLRKYLHQDEEFNPKEFSEKILENHKFIYTGEQFYVYKNGVFQHGGKQKLHEIIQKKLGSAWTSHKRNEVREWMQDHVYVHEDSIGHPAHLINVKNGMYDLKTGELLPHKASYRSLTQINAEYNPDAKCPRLNQFIKEVFPKETHELIWDHAGYGLLPSFNLKKFLVLVGHGNNGKSVWLNVLTKCLGEENVSHEGLGDLSNNRFSINQLFGKLANIHADIESLPLERTGILKQLTGGDIIRAEIKYGGIFEFHNRAKLYFAVNELPYVKDYNEAFFKRLHIVKCPNSFTAEDADIHLMDKLTSPEARSAWLNLAIDGAHRLMERQRFEEPESVRNAIKQYRHSSDSVCEFVDFHLIEAPGNIERQMDIYNAYQQWCKYHGRKPTSLSTFVKRTTLKTCRPTMNGQRERCFKDVRLSDISKRKLSTGRDAVNIKN